MDPVPDLRGGVLCGPGPAPNVGGKKIKW